MVRILSADLSRVKNMSSLVALIGNDKLSHSTRPYLFAFRIFTFFLLLFLVLSISNFCQLNISRVLRSGE